MNGVHKITLSDKFMPSIAPDDFRPQRNKTSSITKPAPLRLEAYKNAYEADG